MEKSLQFWRNDMVLFFSLLYYSTVSGKHTEMMYQTCGRVDKPLNIECRVGQVIYVRETIISDFHDVSNSTCTLPNYNRYCHIFVNHTDIEYNGNIKAQYTFWEESLYYYADKYGECYTTSTSKVVQIKYQCFSTVELRSICDNLDIQTTDEIFITSPNFPLPVKKQYEGCGCEITAMGASEVQVTAIIINPTATEMWSLSLSRNKGWANDIGKTLLFSTHLKHLNGQGLKLNFLSSRDTTYEPVYMPNKPSGFWLRFKATTDGSFLKLTCYGTDTDGNKNQRSMSPDAVLGISICIIAVFIMFLISVGYFLHYWRKKSFCNGSTRLSTTATCTSDGNSNKALSIEENLNLKETDTHDQSHRFLEDKKDEPEPEVPVHDEKEIFLNHKKDLDFNKTTKEGRIRYSTLPHRKTRHCFDREVRFMSQRVIKADVHRQDTANGCSELNVSVISIEPCSEPKEKVEEDKKEKEEPEALVFVGMFDYRYFCLTGATDVGIDV